MTDVVDGKISLDPEGKIVTENKIIDHLIKT